MLSSGVKGNESHLKQAAEGLGLLFFVVCFFLFFSGMGIGTVLEETVLYHLLPSLVQRRGKGQECHAPLLAA